MLKGSLEIICDSSIKLRRQPFRGFCCIDPRKIIKSGGLASIGAWRTVIEDLAVATVKCLKEELEKREI